MGKWEQKERAGAKLARCDSGGAQSASLAAQEGMPHEATSSLPQAKVRYSKPVSPD